MPDTEKLLKDYGYTQDGDVYAPARASSERWEKVEGGWHCYARATATIGGGMPWGKDAGDGYVQVPYRQSEQYKDVGGLHPAIHPEAFEWVWPDERVNEIYAHAVPAGDNPWRKTDEGKYVREDV